MITKESTYKKALEEISKNLKEKTAQREMLLASAYTANPRLAEIDRNLAALGASLAITAMTGDENALAGMKKRSKLLSAEKAELLSKAQVPPIQYDCNICRDTGYVGGKICGCVKKRAATIMAAELSKEMPLKDSRFDNFDLKYYANKNDGNGENPRRRMTAILKLCKEYVINFDPAVSANLLFMGSAGLGKTHLTLALVSGVIEKGYLPIYGSAENLFAAIEAEKFSGEGRGTYDAILNCDLLVIDDLGAEMATSFTKSVLYNLVNTRILSRKPTIISTNLSMKEIESRYTARIASRFIGNYEAHKFLGLDIRQQKRLEDI